MVWLATVEKLWMNTQPCYLYAEVALQALHWCKRPLQDWRLICLCYGWRSLKVYFTSLQCQNVIQTRIKEIHLLLWALCWANFYSWKLGVFSYGWLLCLRQNSQFVAMELHVALKGMKYGLYAGTTSCNCSILCWRAACCLHYSLAGGGSKPAR